MKCMYMRLVKYAKALVGILIFSGVCDCYARSNYKIYNLSEQYAQLCRLYEEQSSEFGKYLIDYLDSTKEFKEENRYWYALGLQISSMKHEDEGKLLLAVAELEEAAGFHLKYNIDMGRSLRNVYESLMDIYLSIKDYKKATQYMNECARLYEGHKQGHYYSGFCTSASEIYEGLCDIDNAIKYKELAIENTDKTDYAVYSAQLRNLSFLYLEKGLNGISLRYAKEACEVSTIIKEENLRAYLNCVAHLAVVYRHMGLYNSALDLLDNDFIAQYISEFGVNSRNSAGLLRDVAFLNYLAGDIENYVTWDWPSFSLYKKIQLNDLTQIPYEEQVYFWENTRNDYHFPIQILRNNTENEYLLEYIYDIILFNKGLLLNANQVRLERKPQDEFSVELDDVIKGCKEHDVFIEFIHDNVEEPGALYALILHHAKDSVACVKINSCAGFDDSYSFIWEPIIKAIDIQKGENIFFSSDGPLHKMPIEYAKLPNGCLLNEVYNVFRVSSTREAIGMSTQENLKSAILFGGITYDSYCQKGKSQSLGSSLLEQKERNFLCGLLGFLRDADRAKLEYLPMSRVEVDSIEYILDESNVSTTKYISEEGSEESFKSMSHNAPQILHIATHGYYIPITDAEKMSQERLSSMTINPNSDEYNSIIDYSMDRTGLLLAGAQKRLKGEQIPEGIEDGILTANEISRLDLRGTDLVVLSACNTGMGDITSDGVAGLQRGFKLAGVKSILMSLWKVDDAATCMLMTQFYRNLLSGKSKHESLRDAQRYLRNYEQDGDHIFEDVKYWGGFVLLD